MNGTVAGAVGVEPGRLPAALARRLRVVEREAAALGQPVWWAGGGVRDLLLGRLAGDADLDLVLEDDPGALARALRAAMGGRLVEHPPFLTTTLETESDGRIDLARARRESYPRPGALPVVEPAPLEPDLGRRDFTLNALALPARVPPEGLIDPFGGRKDLAAGLLRVLHPRSFLDDPTRVLRAVRFEIRFGFRLDPESEELARAAIRSGALATLSGDRLRRELDLTFESWSGCAPALRRLAELGVLAALGCAAPDARTASHLERATGRPDLHTGVARPWHLVRLALRLDAPPPTAEALAAVLVDPADRERARDAGRRVAMASETLSATELRPSEAARALEPLDSAELLWVAAAGERERARVDRYLARDRDLRLAIGGRELLAAGIEEGPAIGRALELTRRARIDGEITVDEELAFALGRARPEEPR